MPDFFPWWRRLDFDLSEEQQLLKNSVERLMRDSYSFEDHRKHLSEERGFSQTIWARYAELGLLALPFAEDHGASAVVRLKP